MFLTLQRLEASLGYLSVKTKQGPLAGDIGNIVLRKLEELIEVYPPVHCFLGFLVIKLADPFCGVSVSSSSGHRQF